MKLSITSISYITNEPDEPEKTLKKLKPYKFEEDLKGVYLGKIEIETVEQLLELAEKLGGVKVMSSGELICD